MNDRSTASKRLVLSLAVAGSLHAAVVLGISFDFETHPEHAIPSLDVILVQTRSATAPEKAQYLAQANQVGGGESDTRERPSETFASRVPKPEPGITPRELTPSQPAPQTRQEAGGLVVTQTSAPTAVEQREQRVEQAPTPRPSDNDPLERQLEMARLAAQVSERRKVYADRPKLKFLTANTREYEYAAYLNGWAAKIERIGNLNYPPEARRRGLHGEVMLTVQVRRDGGIASVKVIKSSGQPVLDDAAIQIVRMAAPFASIPNARDGEYDILDITRTWRFLPGNVLRSE
jgi:protein TonB